MADKAHMELLKRGVDEWNLWKKSDYETIPDLVGADLAGANLNGIDLREADLVMAHLRGARLSKSLLNRADLRGTDLSGADLHEADLSGADLRETDLRGARLSSANLTEANLIGTDLRRADLNGARLHGVSISFTELTGIDFSNVDGLETAKHLGPSTIDIGAFSRSQGLIPERFLRGCGLSNWEIEATKLYRADLSNKELIDILYRIHDLRAQQSIQVGPLFISYSHTDGAFVNHLEGYLMESGILFWRDVHHSTAGRLERQIDRAIRLNPTVLVILSASAVSSDWVEHEVRLGRKLEKEIGREVLCPIALDESWKNCAWPKRLCEQLMEHNVLDFSDWRDATAFDQMYRRLVEGLNLFYRKDGE
jgi:uncharacterized protein YjbI with pentapeptide repeats